MHLVYQRDGQHKKSNRPAAIAIGNFDGVHKGHQALLSHLINIAQVKDMRAMVLTFEPHPKALLSPETALPRLSTFKDKIQLLKQFELDQIVVQRFSQSLANLSGHAFVEKRLLSQLNAGHLVVGDDFHFGKDRAYHAQALKALGKIEGLDVDIIEALCIDGERISSTRIREALKSGNLDLATDLLGHPYCVTGHIHAGQQLGRQLGFPTLNIRVSDERLPVKGVFATEVLYGGQKYPAITNVGHRPTIEPMGRLLIEAHILVPFKDTPSTRTATVFFLKKIRDEQRFNSLAELQSAIARDKNEAITYFQLTE